MTLLESATWITISLIVCKTALLITWEIGEQRRRETKTGEFEQ